MLPEMEFLSLAESGKIKLDNHFCFYKCLLIFVAFRNRKLAEVAELVDAHVSGACEVSRVGSIPTFCTK